MYFYIHNMLKGVKYPQGYIEFKDTYRQNCNGYIHVFEVQLFSDVVDDIIGSRVIPQIVYFWFRSSDIFYFRFTVMSKQFDFVVNGLDLSHWDPCRGGSLQLYHCNMVEWSWWGSSVISTTNWFPSVI